MNDIKNATATTAIKVAVYKDGSLFRIFKDWNSREFWKLLPLPVNSRER